MNRFALAALFSFALPTFAVADVVDVSNLGSILNQSVSLPANSTPGSGIAFEQYFSFSLPTAETVTASVSDSGIFFERVQNGILSLNMQVGLVGIVPFGSLIDSSPFTNTVGGQEATVGPDNLAAGTYFAEFAGISGSTPLRLAIDGTVTATSGVGSTIPETSTWAMLVIGACLMGFVGWRKRENGTKFAF